MKGMQCGESYPNVKCIQGMSRSVAICATKQLPLPFPRQFFMFDSSPLVFYPVGMICLVTMVTGVGPQSFYPTGCNCPLPNMMPGTILPQSLVENYLFNICWSPWPGSFHIAMKVHLKQTSPLMERKGNGFSSGCCRGLLDGRSHLLLGSGSRVQEAEADQTGQS